MSTLLAPASFSTFAPVDDPQFAAECALHELTGHVRALRIGAAPFNVLTPAERADQLAQLLDADEQTRPALATMTESELRAVIADYSTPVARLAAAIREIVRRNDVIPSPAERRRIESEDEEYHRQLTIDREAESAEFDLDTPLHGRTFASVG